jgi:hypothetical protein
MPERNRHTRPRTAASVGSLAVLPKHSIATLRRRLRFWNRLRPTPKPARNNLLPHHQGKGQRPVQMRCPFRILGARIATQLSGIVST